MFNFNLNESASASTYNSLPQTRRNNLIDPNTSYALQYRNRRDTLLQPVQLIPSHHQHHHLLPPHESSPSQTVATHGEGDNRSNDNNNNNNNNNSNDGRTHSLPCTKYGPYRCPHPQCKDLIFTTSQKFGAHVRAKHYTSETPKERKARKAARLGDKKKKLSLGYTDAGLSVIPNHLNFRPLRLGGRYVTEADVDANLVDASSPKPTDQN